MYLCKGFLDIIIVAEILVFPQSSYKEDDRCAAYLNNIRGNQKGNITLFVDSDKMVFDCVTVDWCVT